MEANEYLMNLARKQPKSPHFIWGGRREKGLAKVFKELDFKVGVEVGVLRGQYSEVLCKTIPDLKLYCVDAWEVYDKYVDFGDELKSFYDLTKERLAPYNCELIRKYSMDAVKDFEDESLDFVYIDGNHTFEYVTNDIAEWSKKVKKGGIISGHDFFRKQGELRVHVKDVVQAWTYSHQIKDWFVIRGDKHPSWAWVKE